MRCNKAAASTVMTLGSGSCLVMASEEPCSTPHRGAPAAAVPIVILPSYFFQVAAFNVAYTAST